MYSSEGSQKHDVVDCLWVETAFAREGCGALCSALHGNAGCTVFARERMAQLRKRKRVDTARRHCSMNCPYNIHSVAQMHPAIWIIGNSNLLSPMIQMSRMFLVEALCPNRERCRRTGACLGCSRGVFAYRLLSSMRW
jgi:hypothetical protein